MARTTARIRASAARKGAGSYNEFKTYQGEQYTGMQVGRSHKWRYDAGDWRETKVTPDLWEISYAVTKRRAGHAPRGSGVPVGTGYHWYILAHQRVEKLNDNDYSTSMVGMKYKLAHHRVATGKWSASSNAQRKHLVAFLKKLITQLEGDPIPLTFDWKNNHYKGEALPLPEACTGDECFAYDIMLNDEYFGIIHRMKSGWKMKNIKEQSLVNAIGKQLSSYFKL